MKQVKLLALMSLVATGAKAQDIPDYLFHEPTQSDVGGTGLLQMPSARMNREGEMGIFYYDNDEYRRLGVSLQVFPWLEAVIRYNDVRTRLYNPNPDFSGDQTYKDRGVDVKVRVWEESRYLPSVSLGLRDFAGTGQFSGEFLAASKRWNNFDFTLGIGWGYLGRSGNITNPLCKITDSYCERPGGFTGKGGSFEFKEWFKGNAALYGGVEWQTPWEPLSVKVEYDGNDYSDESSETPIIQDSHWNMGLHYRLSENANIQISYERGNTIMFGFNFRANFNDLKSFKVHERKRTGSDLQQAKQPQSVDQIDTQQLASDMYKEAGWAHQKLVVSDDGKELVSYGVHTKYRNHQEGIERSARILSTYVPESVKTYKFIDIPVEMPVRQSTVDADKLKDAMRANTIDADTASAITFSDVDQAIVDDTYKGDILQQNEFELGWPSLHVRPYVQQSFGGPENFYLYDLRADIYSNWALSKNLFINARAAVRLAGNYDEFNYKVQGDEAPLPRVRTFIRDYVDFSDVWLENLQATYVKQLSKNWFGSVYGGYFERMFGGVGAEVMYRPYNNGWGIGGNVNWAKQRSFNSHFGFYDYSTVTGHITGYIKPDLLPDSMIRVAAGRFLAKDWGIQVNFDHKFDSGLIVGAFASKTNVSAEDYGEGSFTKGFYISIPLDMFKLKNDVGRANFGWTPLTRDGGQMLIRQSTLLGITDQRDAFFSN